MASNYPTSLDNFSNPSGTDSLNSPSHSLQHSDINDAVEALQTKVGIGASPAGSATAGQVLTAQGGGTALWQDIPVGGAWTSYTPTWTNLTIGNGTNLFAYKQIGKTVFVSFRFTMGSTSSMGSSASFTLPVTASSNMGTNTTFNLYIEDNSIASYAGIMYLSSSTAMTIACINYGTTYGSFAATTATVPFTWGTNDFISGAFFYEAA